MPTCQPAYPQPTVLPAPSVYVAPTPNWSGTVDDTRHVQPAPVFVPVVPTPLTPDRFPAGVSPLAPVFFATGRARLPA